LNIFYSLDKTHSKSHISISPHYAIRHNRWENRSGVLQLRVGFEKKEDHVQAEITMHSLWYAHFKCMEAGTMWYLVTLQCVWRHVYGERRKAANDRARAC
jgi:hypothetical protein